MRLFILGNPSSGKGNTKSVIEKIKSTYPQLEVITFLTRFKGDEAYQVEQYLKNGHSEKDRLLILGGDGTLSQFLKVLPKEIAFAYYPTGSGNDFARALDIRNLDSVIEAVMNNQKEPITVFTYENGVIVNSLDFGFVAKVISYSEQSWLKKLLKVVGLGKLSYLLYAIKALFLSSNVSVEVVTDQKTLSLDNIFFISFANNTYFGGGIMIWPEASTFNSYLDLVYIVNQGFFGNIRALLDLLCHRHQTSPRIHHLSLDEVSFSLTKGNLAQVDGELIALTQGHLTSQELYIYR